MRLPNPAEARELAAREFETMPIRFCMEKGNGIRENASAELTGPWPRPLPIRSFRDLGVPCAMVHLEAEGRGGHDAAARLKSRLGRRWPASLMVAMYVQALRDSVEELRPFLEPRTIAEIDSAMRTGRSWIAPLGEDEL
jgi:hypothetical protein